MHVREVEKGIQGTEGEREGGREGRKAYLREHTVGGGKALHFLKGGRDQEVGADEGGDRVAWESVCVCFCVDV